jgi:hypothetical protein
MKLQIYELLHVFSVIFLTGLTFFSFASPRPEQKRLMMIMTGILGLVILVSAFGMISVIYENHFTGWMIVKIGCWLGLTALGGIVYRRPEKAPAFLGLATLLVLVAVFMVYFRPL